MRLRSAICLTTLLACSKPDRAPNARAARADSQALPALPAPTDSVGRFVQAFYERYAARFEHGYSWDSAVHDNPGLLAPAMVSALRTDAKAQAQSSDEIVGLDGDPILNAQDICGTYQFGPTRQAGDTLLVDVYEICGGARKSIPRVTAELIRHGASWQFVNFLYPDQHTDLMRTLEDLRRERQH